VGVGVGQKNHMVGGSRKTHLFVSGGRQEIYGERVKRSEKRGEARKVKLGDTSQPQLGSMDTGT